MQGVLGGGRRFSNSPEGLSPQVLIAWDEANRSATPSCSFSMLVMEFLTICSWSRRRGKGITYELFQRSECWFDENGAEEIEVKVFTWNPRHFYPMKNRGLNPNT